MSKAKKIELYTINKNVECLKCGNKGAVQGYGEYYENGVKELADKIKSYEQHRNSPHMSHYMSFGGTMPHECLNCSNSGLIDIGNFEGFKMAFKTIENNNGE